MIRTLCSIICSLTISQALAAPASSMASQAKSSKAAKEIVVRGHVVCLDDKGRPSKTCVEGAHRFGLRTSDNKLYSFLTADSLAEMFEDPIVRERTLQITGNPIGDNRLELIKVLSIRDGKLYDIFYFCDVCNITAYAPGPCACCRKEMELKETPALEPE